MRHDRWQKHRWQRYGLLLGLAGVLWGRGVFTPQWLPQRSGVLLGQVQAQEAPKGHEHGEHHHEDQVDLIPFMMRNAYHLSTLYHAGRAAQWELAAHEVAGLGTTLDQAAVAAPKYAGFLRDFKQEHVEALKKAVETRQAQPFSAAFLAAVHGCNDCHKATNHAFIVIPEAPPNLSILTLPPASGDTESAPKAPQDTPHQGHKH